MNLDRAAARAAIHLVGRSGAKHLEVGYLDEDAPTIEQARWYATATYQGVKLTAEEHPGPVEALEALARRLLTGGKCTCCGGLIALSPLGAIAYSGVLVDGSLWTAAQAVAAGQCHWRREGDRWARGCEGR